jgi:hypothetical protein
LAICRLNLVVFLRVCTITASILSFPVLADRFCRFIQPIRVSQKGDQFDGTEKINRVGFWLAKRTKSPGTGKNGNIIRRAIQQLPSFP